MQIPLITLNNGITMPQIGLGTWKMSKDECEKALHEALSLGYRLIDTAKLYGNESAVGKAMRESKIKREEMFITTKLWPTDFFNPRKAFEHSLHELGLPYVDLYLIHWPLPLMPKSIWKTLEKIYEEKLARAIGVSNYSVDQLRHTISYAHVVPAVNQVSFSPFDYKKDVLEFCKQYDVVLEAYSPLARGNTMHNPILKKLAAKYKKTPAQIMLHWSLQRGAIPIPKTTHKERMQENMDVFDFEIATGDLWELDELSTR